MKFSIIHEFGHIIDNYLNTISSSEDWKHITNVYAKRAVNHRDNFFTNEIPSEFFSDCVLTYCINKELFGEYLSFKEFKAESFPKGLQFLCLVGE